MSATTAEISPAHLLTLNQPSPRYTSYPPAPAWETLPHTTYPEALHALAQTPGPLSLYVHIPFCRTMCLYCGCSVVLNRNPENEATYVDYLLREIDLVCAHLGTSRPVCQLHFGGGTPTQLSCAQFARLFDKIHTAFALDYSQEIAIEIDPRTVHADGGEKLRFLKKLGFNRISFGVQDTDPKVQQAVRRHQSLETTLWTYNYARTLGFTGINIDLIYGLPYQTPATFAHTVEHILQMRPDRIAFFSYAKVPWLKPHQKAIREETLPTTEEKFLIYAQARAAFIRGGYTAVGMDHFALAHDTLALGYQSKTLQRNFQGYSLRLCEESLSFGVTAIGCVQNTYIQNLKELPAYYAHLDQGMLPLHRGKILTSEDRLRKWVIHTLMCSFHLNKEEFATQWNEDFDTHFQEALPKLAPLAELGLVENTPTALVVSPLGELFVRLIARCFDAYYTPSPAQFSHSI